MKGHTEAHEDPKRMTDDELDDEPLFALTCPYCGEAVDIYVESDVHGSFVQDCDVCCNPWLVRVTRGARGRHVSIVRSDGSE